MYKGFVRRCKKTFEGMPMKARDFGPAVVWALVALACHTSGECIAGHDATDCPSGAFCYAGEDAKPGDRGVCTQLPPEELSPEELPSETLPRGTPVPVDGLAIHSFSPTEATHGTLLVIQGSHFSAVPAENSVTFNGVPATVASAIPNEIKVFVPKSTLSSGPVRVSVAGKTVVSAGSFTYMPMVVAVTTVAGYGDTKSLNLPCSIALDAGGNLYVAEFGNNRIRKITPQGESTFAGTSGSEAGHVDGVERNARFQAPCGITTDAKDYLYVTDGGIDNGRIRRISMQAQVSTLADDMRGFVENPASYEKLSSPRGIVRDADGNLYVADTNNHRIQKISPEGRVLTLAGKSGVTGSADGEGEEARFNSPRGVAQDLAGNLYVTDDTNNRIRRISPEGRVSTFSNGQGFVENPKNAMKFLSPRSIAIDKTGIFYVVETDGHRIQQMTPSGKVSILVGNGTGSFKDGKREDIPQFNSPRELVIDAQGNLLLADYLNHRIRKIILE